ncbi:hypothetical protein QLQ15_06695 [Lysobacter sp. LF1]|uniref:Uncharacterized protein n=1 Tax=Lysobacter stagni TaxID=3045172 RepID=A0ABT6XEM8_9GAMM|nr:hypothetical protein [Lysobacter sp. LF1]MDI9238602.1 hypothetical protein [Lysobacter sp. LF1]
MRSRSMRWWLMVMVCACGVAMAQDLRPDSLKQYGGTYSPACGDVSAPRVRISAEGLEIAHGTRTLRTPARMDSYTSFGAAPTSPVPEGYRVEFIGDDFSLYVFEDAKGLHVPLQDFVPAALAVVGANGMKARFARCER